MDLNCFGRNNHSRTFGFCRRSFKERKSHLNWEFDRVECLQYFGSIGIDRFGIPDTGKRFGFDTTRHLLDVGSNCAYCAFELLAAKHAVRQKRRRYFALLLRVFYVPNASIRPDKTAVVLLFQTFI